MFINYMLKIVKSDYTDYNLFDPFTKKPFEFKAGTVLVYASTEKNKDMLLKLIFTGTVKTIIDFSVFENKLDCKIVDGCYYVEGQQKNSVKNISYKEFVKIYYSISNFVKNYDYTSLSDYDVHDYLNIDCFKQIRTQYRKYRTYIINKNKKINSK